MSERRKSFTLTSSSQFRTKKSIKQKTIVNNEPPSTTPTPTTPTTPTTGSTPSTPTNTTPRSVRTRERAATSTNGSNKNNHHVNFDTNFDGATASILSSLNPTFSVEMPFSSSLPATTMTTTMTKSGSASNVAHRRNSFDRLKSNDNNNVVLNEHIQVVCRFRPVNERELNLDESEDEERDNNFHLQFSRVFFYLIYYFFILFFFFFISFHFIYLLYLSCCLI